MNIQRMDYELQEIKGFGEAITVEPQQTDVISWSQSRVNALFILR